MRDAFDRRVVPEATLRVVRAIQTRIQAHLGGGAALSGAFLAHRLSQDIDMVCHDAEDVRCFVRELPHISQEAAVEITLVRDAGTFVRASAYVGEERLEIDVVLEATPDLEAAAVIEGVTVESFADLRAAKITCLLSRSEPRDLVDVLFLDRAGHPPEHDLSLALQKDAGIDPGVIAWLLGQFPTHPLPVMLQPLTEEDLLRYRDELRERLRRLAVPG